MGIKRGFTSFIESIGIILSSANNVFFGTYPAPSGNTRSFAPLQYCPRPTTPWKTTDPSDIANGDPASATIFSCPGTISNVYIYIVANSSTMGNLTFQFFKNGADVGPNVTFNPDGSGLPVLGSDLVSTLHVDSADLLAVRCDQLGSDADCGGFVGAFTFTPD